MVDKSDLFVSAVYKSLYPSAMAHKVSKWPKIETAKSKTQQYSDWRFSSFNTETWWTLNKSGFFKLKY